jgi:hypothetical protein
MQHPKPSAMLLALALGAALSAGAQTIIQTVPADSQAVVVSPPSAIVVEPAVVETTPVIVLRLAPVPVPDPAADAKCHFLVGNDYWDCVNSHSAGQ